MPLDDQHKMSPDSIEAIESFLEGRAVAGPLVRDEDLVDFVMGTVPADAESKQATIIAELSKSPQLRRRMLEIRTEVLASRVAQPSDRPVPEGIANQVADRIRHAISYYTRRGAWVVPDFDEESPPNFDRAILAGVLSNIGRLLRQSQQFPQFATVRAEADLQSISEEFVLGGIWNFSVYLDGEGSLHAKGVQRAGGEELGIHSQSSVLWLHLIDPSGGFVCLGQSEVISANWSLDCPGFSAATGLGPSAISHAMFRLSEKPYLEGLANQAHLFAETPLGEFVPLVIVQVPAIVAGNLQLGLAIGSDAAASFQGHRLRLSIVVAKVKVQLGEWPVETLVGGGQLLQIPIGDAEDAKLVCMSAFFADIIQP